MSDEEEVMSGEEEESEEEESRAPEPSGPSEAELAMQRRRQQQSSNYGNLDEEAQELLENNKTERDAMDQEIRELQERRERRKKEREQEDRDNAKRRAEEETRRKKEEEDRQNKKLEEEGEKRDARAAKLAEFEKFKNDSKPNFIITKKTGAGADTGDDDEAGENKKSKEQLEAEKKAILEQRIPKLEIDGADTSKLTDKAKELHALIMRLESEKYDLEKRFKAQQYDMMELAERARQMNKVGKGGQLKRVQLTEDVVDVMSERFAGCPSKIEMFSTYERCMDKRTYGARQGLFTGPQYGYAANKIKATKQVKWSEEGLPEYQFVEGYVPPAEEGEGEEAAAAAAE